jgi:WhiB family transcriptional regulator, redox-sensing transcriptional regulator
MGTSNEEWAGWLPPPFDDWRSGVLLDDAAADLPAVAWPTEQAWMHDANCRGLHASAFFPSDASGVEAARRVCAECSVRSECLEYSLVNRLDHGIWGGTSERQRQRLLRQRRSIAERSS